jgi:hypothetical protein
MPAWINRQPVPRGTQVGLQKSPCMHPYYDNKLKDIHGFRHYWRECLDCGAEFNGRRVRLIVCR